ncbi:TIGR03086 family metal-binding protein [Mycobacterium sp. ITM-2016-00317]|uniref:TIGR03086 family metal-binding protein n=1 Tax=Mycobacterium sp. ITM-2016-00317 TaxID=2099694 RepID=UPI00287FA0F7|nr:TIGR03086 family metal-binding protein [Mycobacterium sp. ITM-2016-00317]WNG87373.1 TIGR03086 family metal-binding protein [Mycobacterium sp. ITM-2016-00317]
MIDMTKACGRTAGLLSQVRDDQLQAATPCREMNLGAVIAHLGGLAPAFDAAARKDFGPLTDTPPQLGDGPEADWRQAYPPRLTALAEAWRDPAAWQGMSRAGGVDFPAEVGGMIALCEVVVHGWDVAASAGLAYDVDDRDLEALLPHVRSYAEEAPIEGLFAAPVPVGEDAPLLDRVIALTGRDPGWAS